METLYQGEMTLVRKFKPCCRCGEKTEIVLPKQYWKRFKKLNATVVCPDCLGVSDSEEEREMYAESPANLYLAEESIFDEPLTNDYSDYLRSEHWKKTRIGALERAKHRCQVCTSENNLHVHHRTYGNIGNEQPEDLIVLCRGCHYLFHKRMNINAVRVVKEKEPQCLHENKKPSVAECGGKTDFLWWCNECKKFVGFREPTEKEMIKADKYKEKHKEWLIKEEERLKLKTQKKAERAEDKKEKDKLAKSNEKDKPRKRPKPLKHKKWK